jgi:hypothetical protein
MSVKQTAISDLKKQLKEEGRSFLAFNKKLDSSIQAIVDNYIKQQENV